MSKHLKVRDLVKIIRPDLDGPPVKVRMLVDLLGHVGLLDRWTYEEHLWQVLSHFDYDLGFWKHPHELRYCLFNISGTSMGLYNYKTDACAQVSRILGEEFADDVQVWCVNFHAPRYVAAAIFSEIKFSLGSLGATILRYPIPGLSYREALVRVHDQELWQSFCGISNNMIDNYPNKDSARRYPIGGSQYWLFGHSDPRPREVVPEEEIAKIKGELWTTHRSR